MAYKFQEGAAKIDGSISGSSTIVAKSSISSSADLAVTGNIHFAGEIYGDGSNLTDVSAGPAGSDTQVQYNNGGSMGAASTVTFNDSTLVLSLARTGSFASIKCTGSISGSHELEVASKIECTYGSIEAGSSFIIGSADLNEADLEKLDGITNGTAAAAKAVVLDASKNIATIGTVGCGAITSTGASSLGASTLASLTCTAAATFGGGIGSSGATITTAGAISADGRIITDDTTEATSATDGSLQTDGGLSVAKSAVIGDDLDLLSNGAILNIGSDEIWTATHANANDTLTVSANHRLAFGDAGDYIAGDGTDLKIVSSGDIDMTGDLDVVGTMSCDTSITLDTTTITTAEIGVLDGVTAGAGAASKALVLDASADVASGLRSVTGSGDLKFANVHATTSIFAAGGEMSASKDVYAGDGGNVGFLSRAGMMLGWNGSSDGNLDMGASGYISGASGIEMVGNAVFVGQHAVSGGVQYHVNTVTSHTELTASRSPMYQLVSGGTANIQVLLPSASAGENYQYVIKRHALMSGNVVITSSGGDAVDVDKTIDGEDKITLATAGASVFLISDGAMWNIF